MMLAVFVALLLVAGTSGTAVADHPAHDPKIERLATDAYGAPPEFAADVLLRIAGSARVTDPAWKQRLITEAFLRAYAAAESYRRTSLRVPPDSHQGAEVEAYATGLTRATLQVRAVHLMLTLSIARAREIFEWMDVSPAATSCVDPLVPAVDEYYNLISELARRAFPHQRSEGLQFLEFYLWRAHLPSEMPAVIAAVQQFRPMGDEMPQVEGFLDAVLGAGSLDARGFSAADIDIIGRMADLQFFARQQLQIPGWFLMDTTRAYVVKHLAGPRCSDSATEALMPAIFNGALTLLGIGDTEVKRIEGPVIAPSTLLQQAKIDLFWQTGAARQLYASWLGLRGRDKNPVPESVRRTKEWQDAADVFLTQLDHWNGRDTPNERDYLYQKATLYTDLIDIAPKGPARTRAIQNMLDFLRHEDRDRAARPLWFVFVKRLLELSDGDRRAEILTSMEQSGHPVIALYARTDRLLPVGARKSDRQHEQP
jgi:hypothetical protein